MISFACMFEYIQASPQSQSFRFTPENITAYLKDILFSAESQFPEGICKLSVVAPLAELNDDEEPSMEKAVELLKNPDNMADFGLQVMMMLHNSREINLVDSVIDAIYTAFAEMALAKPIEIQEIPEGADEETTDKIKEANEKATETNKQIEINQKKVSLRVVEQPYDTSDESAFIKLNNIHEEDPAA